jgi:hypothetical protein
VGLEPTTYRLTAGCSAIELPRNVPIWQRPTLPRRLHLSTIGAERLNFCVRYGYRCFPLAIATKSFQLIVVSLGLTLWPLTLSLYQVTKNIIHCFLSLVNYLFLHFCPLFNFTVNHISGQALDLLVPISLKHYCSYTLGLSTKLSSWSLTTFTVWEISS